MTRNRTIREISEREIAIALLLELADQDKEWFALLGFYDHDADVLYGLAERLDVKQDKSYENKLRKVVRRLVAYGVFSTDMRSTAKEYIGEPSKQMEYRLKAGKLRLLQKGKTEHTNEPEWEAAFILRHAYPNPEED